MDIRHVDESYVGEEGYAHAGKLNLFEVQQIMRKRAEEDRTLGLVTKPQTTQSTQVGAPPVIVDIVLSLPPSNAYFRPFLAHQIIPWVKTNSCADV